MAQQAFYVVCVGDRWKIKNGRHEDFAATRELAIGVAIEAANEAGRRGHQAQVLIRGPDAQWRAEWTFGTDPLPAPAAPASS